MNIKITSRFVLVDGVTYTLRGDMTIGWIIDNIRAIHVSRKCVSISTYDNRIFSRVPGPSLKDLKVKFTYEIYLDRDKLEYEIVKDKKNQVPRKDLKRFLDTVILPLFGDYLNDMHSNPKDL